MGKFRFAGERALQFRREREEEARLQLARAEAVRHQAVRYRDALEQVLHAENARLSAVQREGAPRWLLDWHRNWIVRKRADVDAGHRALGESETAVARASATLRVAHRQRRILERWRDRAWSRFVQESNRQEMKELNTLATQQYVRRAAEVDGQDGNGADLPRGVAHEPGSKEKAQ